MKVADFQKCLRSLAELISTKTPAKELTEAADALTPFANFKMDAFAEFLRRVEAKYGETGELPDGRPPKPAPVSRPKKEPTTKAPVPTVDALLSAVGSLKVRLRTDLSLSKDGVAAELSRFEKLKQAELFEAVKSLGMQAKPKSRADALSMIVNHTVSTQGGVERSDA
jgi:hypothetical protein